MILSGDLGFLSARITLPSSLVILFVLGFHTMASVERHDFAPPFFAGGEHLHDRRVGHELHRRAA